MAASNYTPGIRVRATARFDDRTVEYPMRIVQVESDAELEPLIYIPPDGCPLGYWLMFELHNPAARATGHEEWFMRFEPIEDEE